LGKKQKGGAARIGCAALAVIYTGLGETMRRISIKGVLIGAIADTFLSSFFGILAAIVVVVMSHMTHLPREVFHRHGILYAVLTLNGLALSVLGGYFISMCFYQHLFHCQSHKPLSFDSAMADTIYGSFLRNTRRLH
jgi:hypothetical protein